MKELWLILTRILTIIFVEKLWYRFRYFRVYGKTPSEARKLGYLIQVIGTDKTRYAMAGVKINGRLNVRTKNCSDRRQYGEDGVIFDIRYIG